MADLREELVLVQRKTEHVARDETDVRRDKDAALRRRTRAELDLKEA